MEIEGADKARHLQQILGWPSDQALITALQGNQILNCPITADDSHRALAIYGPVVLILAGKMVRRHKPYNTTTNKEQVVVHPFNITKIYTFIHIFASSMESHKSLQ